MATRGLEPRPACKLHHGPRHAEDNGKPRSSATIRRYLLPPVCNLHQVTRLSDRLSTPLAAAGGQAPLQATDLSGPGVVRLGKRRSEATPMNLASTGDRVDSLHGCSLHALAADDGDVQHVSRRSQAAAKFRSTHAGAGPEQNTLVAAQQRIKAVTRRTTPHVVACRPASLHAWRLETARPRTSQRSHITACSPPRQHPPPLLPPLSASTCTAAPQNGDHVLDVPLPRRSAGWRMLPPSGGGDNCARASAPRALIRPATSRAAAARA